MDRLYKKLYDMKGNGKKLLGCFPLYPPLELFHSMDLEPVVLWGVKPFFPQTSKSDRHLQPFVCSVGRHLTEFVLSQASVLLDGLFMYNACDTLRNLPEVLDAGLQDDERQLPILNMHVPMVPRSQTDATSYLKNEIRNLIVSLEETFGCAFSQLKFEESLGLYRKARNAAKNLEQAVGEAKMDFGEFSSLMHGNCFRPVEKQLEVLESRLAHVQSGNHLASDGHAKARVIVSGILPPSPGICHVMADAGLIVAGNDIASMTRSYNYCPERAMSPQDYYVDFYFNHSPCTTLLGTADDRIGFLERLVQERDADGLIFFGEKFCEYEYFEFPYMEKLFNKRGIPTLLLELSMEDDQNLGAYRTRIEAFAELMA